VTQELVSKLRARLRELGHTVSEVSTSVTVPSEAMGDSVIEGLLQELEIAQEQEKLLIGQAKSGVTWISQSSFLYCPRRRYGLRGLIECKMIRRVSIALRHSQKEFTEFYSLRVC
jgi:hypothetical protein